ncbi:Arylsulfatase [Pontiella desulfatans]|uniref:Arylsulfatase n=1 Tax=Pontiella desulfatans TaxID=2750659 RepID=A0A6C2U293_PONDE|nr:sulfatase [Pontiella desulfatans]SPS73811.1 sulfatase S1_8 [Kiritimatiellales bacterium]VGO13516.1 Arylsulfatase [Pontiella desulfatans]
MKRLTTTLFCLSLLTSALATEKPLRQAQGRPNILWIVVEDMSCHFGYQGEKLVHTPNVDKLAGEGVVFENAYVAAPVCSASRSGMITGMYQTSIGAHNHRSSRGAHKIQLPKGIKTIPEIFKANGYYTCNSQENPKRYGKEDYNFVYSRKKLYDAPGWSKRANGQPFFAQIQLRGGKLRNVEKWNDEVNRAIPEHLVSPDEVTLPPYYPDCAEYRKDWAEYLNSVTFTDLEVGKIIKRLKTEKLLDNTVIFFITDHGISQARGKQFLYDEGARIPFIVWAPKHLKPQVKEELIAHIDMAATSLEFAGIKIPETMDAKPLFNENHQPREFVVTARDRCDETVDHIRSVRKGNLKYIKNYLPNRPYLQPCDYKDTKPWMQKLRQLDQQGKLNAAQKIVTAQTRPTEELYDLSADPFEINNLAADKAYASKLEELRTLLSGWVKDTGDQGISPESEESYGSSMAAYLSGFIRRKDTEKVQSIEANIAVMKKWASEGK